MTWAAVTWRILVDDLRSLPHRIRAAHDRAAWVRRQTAYIAEELRAATWTCERHHDAWRRPDGTFLKLYSIAVLPLSREDAEDFHGFGR